MLNIKILTKMCEYCPCQKLWSVALPLSSLSSPLPVVISHFHWSEIWAPKHRLKSLSPRVGPLLCSLMVGLGRVSLFCSLPSLLGGVTRATVRSVSEGNTAPFTYTYQQPEIQAHIFMDTGVLLIPPPLCAVPSVILVTASFFALYFPVSICSLTAGQGEVGFGGVYISDERGVKQRNVISFSSSS